MSDRVFLDPLEAPGTDESAQSDSMSSAAEATLIQTVV